VNGSARGTLPRNHSHAFMPSRKAAFDNADVILLAGTPLDFRMGYGRRLNPKAKIVIMDMDYKNVGNNRDFDFGLVGNLKTILNAMCEASAGDKSGKHDAFLQMLREDEKKSQGKNDKIIAANEVPIHPVRLCHEINEFLLEDTVYIGDGGDIVTFSGGVVQPKGPGLWMDPGPLGTIGVGMPFCIGAKQARPDREVVCLFGDGAFSLTGFDFDTAVRFDLPFVGIVGNNSYMNQIRYGQIQKYGEERGDIGNKLSDIRYSEFAKMLGGYGEEVTEPKDIRPAIERARESGKPSLINVWVDPNAFAPGTMNQTMYK